MNMIRIVNLISFFIFALFNMTPWHGNAFHIAGPLWEEYTGNRWIPLKVAGIWCTVFCCKTGKQCWTNTGITNDFSRIVMHKYKIMILSRFFPFPKMLFYCLPSQLWRCGKFSLCSWTTISIQYPLFWKCHSTTTSRFQPLRFVT